MKRVRRQADTSGKIALVTSGAHRVGKAIVPMPAGGGADLVVTYRASDSETRNKVSEAAHSVARAGILALTRQFPVELSPVVWPNAVGARPVLPPAGLDVAREKEVASTTLLNR